MQIAYNLMSWCTRTFSETKPREFFDRPLGERRLQIVLLSASKLLALIVAIFILSFVSVRFTHEFITPLWLSNAVLLGVLLRQEGDRGLKALVLGGGGLAILLANVAAGLGLFLSAALAAANVAEVGLAVWLFRQLSSPVPDVARARGLSVLILVAGVIAPLVGAALSTAAVAAASGTLWYPTWFIAYAADALGMVIIVPFALALTTEQWRKAIAENRAVEALGFLVVIVLVVTGASNNSAFLVLLVPIVLAAAFRFGTVGAATTSAVVGTVASIFIVSGIGTPALSHLSLPDRAIALQLILAATTLIALAVAAALNERDQIVLELSQAKSHAEAQTRLALDAAEIGTWNFDLITDQLALSDRVKGILGIPITPEPSRAAVSDSIYPEDRGIFIQGLTKCLEGNDDHLKVEYRVGDPDSGTLRWVRSWGRLDRDSAGKGLRVQGVLQDITEQKQAALERDDLLRRLIQAQEHERFRLARDLHDQSGQDLAAVMLELKGIETLVHDSVRDRVCRLRTRLDEMSATLHRVVWELRPASIDELGLAKSIGTYVSDWSVKHRIDADFYCSDDDVDDLPEEIGIVIFRVIQESLTNIVKHAKEASSVSVIIRRDGPLLQATIEDNGCGFDTKLVGRQASAGNRGTLGLVGMRERLWLIGGEMEVESSAGAGTAIFARIKQVSAGAVT